MKEKTRLIHEKEAVLLKEYNNLKKQGFAKDSEELLELQSKILELHWDFCLDKAGRQYKGLVMSRGEDWNTAVTEIAIVIYLGLADALPYYNPDYGVYFTSFAENYIKQSINKFVQQDLNLKPYDAVLTRQLDIATEAIIQKYGTDNRPISDYEKVSELPTARLIRAQTMRIRSQNVRISEDGFADNLGLVEADPEKKLLEDLQHESLRSALDSLSLEQKQIISLRFGFDGEKALKPRAIAKELNMSEYEVHNLLNDALMKIRENKNVREYYGLNKDDDDHSHFTKEDFEITSAL